MTGRDRLLAALFALQLLAAGVFGIVLVYGLSDEPRTSEVLTARSSVPSPRSAIATMYSRSAGVARSYRAPKNPTASSASASGAACITSDQRIGVCTATSQVTLP